jgi:hypothetical protein
MLEPWVDKDVRLLLNRYFYVIEISSCEMVQVVIIFPLIDVQSPYHTAPRHIQPQSMFDVPLVWCTLAMTKVTTD